MAETKHGITGVSFLLVLGAFATGGPFMGIASLLVYLGLCKRKKVDPAEGALGFLPVVGDAFIGAGEVVASAPKVVKQTQQVIKGHKPLLANASLMKSKEDVRGTEILQQSILKSEMIVAPQKSGKTRLLLWYVQSFLESHPEGQVIILDINYGSAHDDEKPNTWFDLPVDEIVFIDSATCLKALHSTNQLVIDRENERKSNLNARASDLGHHPILLVFDEEPGVAFAELDGEENTAKKKEFQGAMRYLIQRGHKQNVFVKVVVHDTTTGTTQLPQSLFTQFDLLLLGAAAITPKYLQYCDVDKKSIEDVKSARETNERAYIARRNGEVTINPMPFIPEPSGIEYVVDHSDPWLDEWLTEERAIALESLPDDARVKADVAMGVFGLSSSQCRNDNPNYVRIKEIWAQLLEDRENPISGNSPPSHLAPSAEEASTEME
ncbi:MAG: hypothetical protein AAGA75_11690 [Cyanobacteria bacterium P01_E01_bin.6]